MFLIRNQKIMKVILVFEEPENEMLWTEISPLVLHGGQSATRPFCITLRKNIKEKKAQT